MKIWRKRRWKLIWKMWIMEMRNVGENIIEKEELKGVYVKMKKMEEIGGHLSGFSENLKVE